MISSKETALNSWRVCKSVLTRFPFVKRQQSLTFSWIHCNSQRLVVSAEVKRGTRLKRRKLLHDGLTVMLAYKAPLSWGEMVSFETFCRDSIWGACVKWPTSSCDTDSEPESLRTTFDCNASAINTDNYSKMYIANFSAVKRRRGCP